jgi:serine/threonine protein kinase
MNPEFDRIQHTFLEVSAIAEPAARQAFLDNVCKGDLELRRQVEALLFSHENAGEFLKRSVVPSAAESLIEAPGTIIGKYKLLQEIGEGGFGVVFMAEQLEPVQRKVALKVLKPGMDTREVIARFEAERQALALMDHPNVARVLDGGTTVSGRPYFVMDLVKGTPITDFCDQNKLSPKDRLNLFMQVCAGVQHAHQKGVIHRDLKPTNVLVTVQDGLPIVKVIDFGIAKAIGQKLTEKTLFTRFEQLLGTPAYMSPEQAQWSTGDVDTRSDIYSLGVLLYELLTGTTPLEKETLARAALDEVRRAIREVDPPAPSTRLQALGPRVTLIAQHRQTEPSQLTHLVQGELDWIVMRAMDKDRTRRYQTANGLSQDVQNYLKDEPITASPASKIYVARKFVRRHRAAVGTATIVVTALLLGLGLALFGLNRARQESARAKNQAEAADALNSFLREQILLQGHSDFTPTRNITLLEVLDKAAPKIETRFKNQPLIAATLHYNVGQKYMNLGEYKKAEEHLRRAVALRLENRQHLSALDRLQPQLTLAGFLSHKNNRGGSEEAGEIVERVAKESASELGTNHWLTLRTQRMLTDAIAYGPNFHHSEKRYRAILDAQTRNSGKDSFDALTTARNLGAFYSFQGRSFEAARLYEDVLSIYRTKDSGLTNEEAPVTLCNLGNCRFRLGEYGKACGIFRECVAIANEVLGTNHPGTIWYKARLIAAEGCLGNWQECTELGTQMPKISAGQFDNGSLRFGYDATYSAALCSLVVSNANAYRQLITRLTEATITSTNLIPELAEVLCMTPPPLYDSAETEQMVGRARAFGVDDRTRIPKAIVEYRHGNFHEALQYLEGRSRFYDLLAAQAAYFVAMADWKLGNTNGALKALDLAREKLGPALNMAYLGEDWNELVMAILAKREAEALIPCSVLTPEPDAAALAEARKRWRPLEIHLDKGLEFGAQMRWAEARDELLAVARSPLFNLNDLLVYQYEVPARITAAVLAAKDENAYLELRAKWLAWCHSADASLIPVDIIEACFVPTGPEAASDAQLLYHVFPYNPKHFNSYLATMLLAFRARDFERVLKLRSPSPDEDGSIRYRHAKRATAEAFRAMALAKTGHIDEGSRLLQELDKEMAPCFEHDNGDDWREIVFCQTALSEAHSLFAELAAAK